MADCMHAPKHNFAKGVRPVDATNTETVDAYVVFVRKSDPLNKNLHYARVCPGLDAGNHTHVIAYNDADCISFRSRLLYNADKKEMRLHEDDSVIQLGDFSISKPKTDLLKSFCSVSELAAMKATDVFSSSTISASSSLNGSSSASSALRNTENDEPVLSSVTAAVNDDTKGDVNMYYLILIQYLC